MASRTSRAARQSPAIAASNLALRNRVGVRCAFPQSQFEPEFLGKRHFDEKV